MTESREATEVRAVLENLAKAIRNKDAAAAIALYAEDVVAYELAPPLRIEAADARNPKWFQAWFDTWASPIESTPHDLSIHVGGDVAVALGLRHMTGTKKDGERIDLWFRASAALARREGVWKIVHVHDSVPFAMDGSERALLDLKP